MITVFLGDYIDRGLESKSVIEAIINEDQIGTKITLRGNHEELMLSSLEDVGRMKSWCAMGGIQTHFFLRCRYYRTSCSAEGMTLPRPR